MSHLLVFAEHSCKHSHISRPTAPRACGQGFAFLEKTCLLKGKRFPREPVPCKGSVLKHVNLQVRLKPLLKKLRCQLVMSLGTSCEKSMSLKSLKALWCATATQLRIVAPQTRAASKQTRVAGVPADLICEAQQRSPFGFTDACMRGRGHVFQSVCLCWPDI